MSVEDISQYCNFANIIIALVSLGGIGYTGTKVYKINKIINTAQSINGSISGNQRIEKISTRQTTINNPTNVFLNEKKEEK